jgi:hypothetical protein
MFARLMRLARLHVSTLATVALVSGGCGGSDDSSTPPRQPTTTASATTTTTAAAPAGAAGLAKPVYPRCGVKRFTKPVTAPLVADGGAQYWRILYQVPVTAPRVADLPSQLTIVEQAPNGRRGSLQGGREIVVAGHKVSLRPATKKTPSNVAQWKTSKAKYILLADGSIAQLRRVIACFP